jgi:hypothetical protein
VSALTSAARVLAEVAKHGPGVLDTAHEVAKFGKSAVEAVNAWVNGDGPEPAELQSLPETTKSTLALARLERVAAGPEYCKHCPFAKHVHFERDGRLVTDSCPGFEAQ